MLAETGSERSQRLDITDCRVNVRLPVIEVRIGKQESTAVSQNPGDLSEFLILELSEILKDTLGYDQVEALAAEPDRPRKQVCFQQVGCRVLDGNIDSIILDICRKQRHHCRGSAADVQKRTVLSAGQMRYQPHSLFEPVPWFAEFKVLVPPEVLFVVPDGIGCLIHGRPRSRTTDLKARQIAFGLARPAPHCGLALSVLAPGCASAIPETDQSISRQS